MKKDVTEIISANEKLETDNIGYIDNSGKLWLDFAKSRLYKLYGLSQAEIREIIFKKEYPNETDINRN